MKKEKTMFVLIIADDEGSKETMCVSKKNGCDKNYLNTVLGERFSIPEETDENCINEFDECVEQVSNGLAGVFMFWEIYWEELPLIQ